METVANHVRSLIVYHKDCNDGLLAAAIAQRYVLQIPGIIVNTYPLEYAAKEKQAAVEQDLINYCKDFRPTTVWFVDQCATVKTLKDLIMLGAVLRIFDHHDDQLRHEANAWSAKELASLMIFDPTKSGAGIIWDYAYPNLSRPLFVNLVEDRDIWKWEFGESTLALFLALKLEARTVDHFGWLLANPDIVSKLVVKGLGLVEYETSIKNQIKKKLNWLAPNLIAVNCPGTFVSEVCHELLEEFSDCVDVVAGYEIQSKQIKFSFRTKNGTAVLFASHLGGGGHPNAAGVTISHLNLAEIFNTIIATNEHPDITNARR